MTKSYVTMEQHICVVCGQPFDTGSILLDQRLRERFDAHTATGWGLCPEDKAKSDDGYVALVGVSNVPEQGQSMKPADAVRTGVIAHLKRHVAREIFNTPIPDGMSVAFVEPDVIVKLQEIMKEAGI